MFGGVSLVRQLAVATSVAGMCGLAAIGAIGPRLPERIDQWQTIIVPGPGESLNVSDVADTDFADHPHHGVIRTFATDEGTPEQITATVDGAPADASASQLPYESVMELQVGDPDVTLTGQHRYELGYTYPDARLSTDRLSINVIGGPAGSNEWDVAKMRATVTGFTLADTECFFGPYGTANTCTITETAPGTYQVDLDNVSAGDSVTIRAAITGRVEPAEIAVLPPPAVRPRPNRSVTVAAVAATGVLVAGLLFFLIRFRGSNRVYAGGAADMAYGSLAFVGGAEQTTRRVTDAQLADMTTVEFEAPRGIAAWEGHVLMEETFGDDTVQAYLSSLAGSGAIDVTPVGSNLVIAAGEKYTEADPADQRHIYAMLSIANPFVTGVYNPQFASLWTTMKADLNGRIKARRWWRNRLRHHRVGLRSLIPFLFFGFVAIQFTGLWGVVMSIARVPTSLWSVVLATTVVVGIVAFIAYGAMLPSRTAEGSAAALQTASFKRFLHESEARHVQWAWENGLLREYSGWAVALGEAAAWSAALQRANVPAPMTATSPMFTYGFGNSFLATRTVPRSSGRGFSGGRIGGFGGGGGFAGGGGGGGGIRGW